jgi:hypothetical protein
MDIEKKLFPNSWELVRDDSGNISFEIVDEEIDNFKCDLVNDDCVEIDVSGYNSIVLSVDSLYRIISLIEDSQSLDDEETE